MPLLSPFKLYMMPRGHQQFMLYDLPEMCNLPEHKQWKKRNSGGGGGNKMAALQHPFTFNTQSRCPEQEEGEEHKKEESTYNSYFHHPVKLVYAMRVLAHAAKKRQYMPCTYVSTRGRRRRMGGRRRGGRHLKQTKHTFMTQSNSSMP